MRTARTVEESAYVRVSGWRVAAIAFVEKTQNLTAYAVHDQRVEPSREFPERLELLQLIW